MQLRELGQKPCLRPSAFFSLIHYFQNCDPQGPWTTCPSKATKSLMRLLTSVNPVCSPVKPVHQIFRDPQLREVFEPTALAVPQLLYLQQALIQGRPLPVLHRRSGYRITSLPLDLTSRNKKILSHLFYKMLLHFCSFLGDFSLFYVALCGIKL